jgi:hypothetical protein
MGSVIMQLSGSKLAGMIMVFNGRYVSGKPELNFNQSLGSDAFLARSGIILHEISQKFTQNTGALWH